MSKICQFGEDVDGYNIPVLNEREIRAAAGIFFLFLFIAVAQIGSKGDFTMLKYLISIFLLDFSIRVFINPKFAPSLILGRLLVRRQTPEYVGARQKKFAWIIGVTLAAIMFVHMVVFNAYSPITGIICMICLVFLFFESAFGICLGCIMYPWFFKDKVQYCPGEVCELKDRQAIQKTSGVQIIIFFLFMAIVTGIGIASYHLLKDKPRDIFGLEEMSKGH